MSYQAVAAVLERSRSRGADRLVLLVIAEAANRSGRGCYRSRSSLATRAGVSAGTVTRSVAVLEALGELEVTRHPGRASEYAVTLPGLLALVRGAT